MVSVMIVDGSDEVRRTLRAVVADVAAPIYECDDAREACVAYSTFRPDWVLMDVFIAPAEGLAAARQIVQSFPAARIVIVTQYDDAQFRTAAREAGACGYVLKDNLFEVLRFLASDCAAS